MQRKVAAVRAGQKENKDKASNERNIEMEQHLIETLGRLRELCLSYPETSERLSHGEPTWFVQTKKTFVMYADHHHDNRVAFWCAAPGGVQEELVRTEPDRFFRPPYVGHRGWLGVWLDTEVDWDEIALIVRDAYHCVAPKRLHKEA